MADEGAGGALKGLSVSGHVLGEIVLKIFCLEYAACFFQLIVQLLDDSRMNQSFPLYLANKSSLAQWTRVIFGTMSSFVLAKS